MKIPFTLGASVLLFANLMLYGCVATTEPTAESSFYTLSSRLRVSETPAAALVDESLAIGIGPVRFPAFLDRPEIVSRTADSELRVDESYRWGGSLKDDFLRVLSENLSQLLGTSRILVEPTEARFPLDFQVIADVLKFENQVGSKTVAGASDDKVTKGKGTASETKAKAKDVEYMAGGEAVFKVRWAILDTYLDQTLMIQESTYRSSATEPGPEAIVVALSETLAAFSRDLADQLRKSSKERKKREKEEKKKKEKEEKKKKKKGFRR